MTKEKLLKKKMVVESGMLAAFLAFLGIVAFIGSSIYDSMEDDKNKLQSKNVSLVTENTAIQERILKASTSIELYQAMVKNNRGRDFNINRETGRNVFQSLREKYHLSLVGNNMFNQITELTGEQYKKKTATIVVSEAELNFDGASDELIFQFITELYKRLSGFMIIDSFQLTKRGEITNQTLVDIGSGKFPSLVSANIRFKWIGMKPLPPKTDAAATPANTGPANAATPGMAP